VNKTRKGDIIINIIFFKSFIIIPSTLLVEFIDFNNIFLDKKVGRLLSYKGDDYIINIKTNPLYGPLYNLLNLELIELRRYLDDALIKG